MTTVVGPSTQTPLPGAPMLPLYVRGTFTFAAGRDTSAFPFAVGAYLTPAVEAAAVWNAVQPVYGLTLTMGNPVSGVASLQLFYPTVLVAPLADCPTPVPVPLPRIGKGEQAAFALTLTNTLNSSGFKTPLLANMNTYFGTATVTNVTFASVIVGDYTDGLC